MAHSFEISFAYPTDKFALLWDTYPFIFYTRSLNTIEHQLLNPTFSSQFISIETILILLFTYIFEAFCSSNTLNYKINSYLICIFGSFLIRIYFPNELKMENCSRSLLKNL